MKILYIIIVIAVSINLCKCDTTVAAEYAHIPAVQPSNYYIWGSAVDKNDNIYVVGYIEGSGTYQFGDGVSVSGACASDVNAVLVKYNSSGVAVWARSVTSGKSFSYFRSVAIDSHGSPVVVGYVHSADTYCFGDGVSVTTTYEMSVNLLIIKYNSAGVAQWANTVITERANYGQTYFVDVAVDVNDNAFAVGAIDDYTKYDFGNGVTLYPEASFQCVVLVKYSTDGAAVWASTLENGDTASGFESVALDAHGNIYAVGDIRGYGRANFGNGVVMTTAVHGENAVLVKYNASGVALWGRNVTVASGTSHFLSTAVDHNGDVIVVGSIHGAKPFEFGDDVSVTGSFANGDNVLVIKYNSAGVAQWARSVDGIDASEFNRVSVLPSGGIIVGGQITGSSSSYQFGDVSVVGSAAGQNAVLIKYNSSGVAVWARSTRRGYDGSAYTSIAAHSNGNIYASGIVSGTGTYDFGDDVVVSGNASKTGVIVKYNPSMCAMFHLSHT